MLQKQINSYESVEGLRTSAKNVIYWTIQYSNEKCIFYHSGSPLQLTKLKELEQNRILYSGVNNNLYLR